MVVTNIISISLLGICLNKMFLCIYFAKHFFSKKKFISFSIFQFCFIFCLFEFVLCFFFIRLSLIIDFFSKFFYSFDTSIYVFLEYLVTYKYILEDIFLFVFD